MLALARRCPTILQGRPPLFDYLLQSGLPSALSFSRANGAQQAINSRGVYASVADGAGRFFHNALTLQPEGLMIEQGVTNFITRASAFDNAYYTLTGINAFGSGSVAESTATLDPFGTNGAEYLQESAANSTHQVSITTNAAISPQSAVALTVLAKARERDRLRIRASETGAATNFIQAIFDLTNGTVISASNGGTGTGAVGSIKALANGFYECTVEGTPSTTGTASSVAFAILDGSNNSTYIGTGTSGLFLAGGQIASAKTSFIPTAGAAATRADESATFDATQLNIPRGRLLVKLPQGGRAAGTILDTTNGAGTGIRLDYTSAGQLRGFVNGVTVTGSGDVTGDANVALEWSPGGVILSSGTLASSLQASSASDPGIPACGATARLGARVGGGSWLNRSILRVAGYKLP